MITTRKGMATLNDISVVIRGNVPFVPVICILLSSPS